MARTEGNVLVNRYEWAVGMMMSFTDETVVRLTIASVTLSLGVIATLEVLLGYAATTPMALYFQLGAAGFAYLAGVWWLFGGWPRLWPLVAFIVLADVGIAVANVTAEMSAEVHLGKLAFFVPLGIVVGCFLDSWMFALHIVISAGAVTGITVWLVAFKDLGPLAAFVVWSPNIVLVIAIPVLLYTIVRAVRMDQEE